MEIAGHDGVQESTLTLPVLYIRKSGEVRPRVSWGLDPKKGALSRSATFQSLPDFPWPRTRCVDPGSILAEQRTMPDEATTVGMQNTDTHICAPSLFHSQDVYIYPTSTGNFPSLEIN